LKFGNVAVKLKYDNAVHNLCKYY